jgi:hypothetical protein
VSGNYKRRVLVEKTLKILVQFVTCRGCGREEECPAEELRDHWPGKRHVLLSSSEEIPEGLDYVVQSDRMPAGWACLATHRTTDPSGFFSRDSGLVSEQGMSLDGMGVYFCNDCTPQIKVSHPVPPVLCHAPEGHDGPQGPPGPAGGHGPCAMKGCFNHASVEPSEDSCEQLNVPKGSLICAECFDGEPH